MPDSRRTRIRRTARIALGLAGLLVIAALAEAIVVAPHHVFIDGRNRSGVMYLHNPGVDPEEVEIDFAFGYPVSDSAGEVTVQLFADPGPDAPSAAGWLRAYPRRLSVAPGQTRAVRLLARPPTDLPEGEYWARALVTSRGARVPVAGGDTAVRVGVTLEIRTVIPITYRNGAVSTELELEGVDARVADDSLIAKVAMRRRGNAAFLGTLRASLRSPRDSVVASTEHHVAVYVELDRRIILPIADVPPGAYTLHVAIDTERSDLSPNEVLPAPPLEATVPIAIP